MEKCVLGTAGLGGVWGSVDPQESIRTILQALENGITAIDTAPAYGDAEKYVGEALRQWSGPVPQISTKVGRLKSFDATIGYYDYSESGICRSLEQSLSTLGITKIDILFLHDPSQIDEKDAHGVVQSLISIKEGGYATKIGIGGNPPTWFNRYLQSGVFDVLMEYNKLNICNTVALNENLPFCITNKMDYFAASPLNMGLLGNKFEAFVSNPPSWISEECLQAALYAKEIADKNNLSLDQLAHRFLLSLQLPFKIVVGAADRQQLLLTLAAFKKGALPEQIMNELENCSINKTA